jgi:TetR/AcrR family transcriptional regulator, mexJK operon transcriptional repressor
MIPSSTPTQKTRTPDERRDAFVAVAREEFLTCGYGATSMSAISAKVGGSKTTLWTYFPSKQELFAAVCDDLVERYGRALEVRLDPAADCAGELKRFALALLETLHTPAIIDMHRLVIGEAGRFPELGAMMYERGPARGKAMLAAFFQACMDRGNLKRRDGMIAAHQFAAMLQAGSVQRHMLGQLERPSDAELQSEAEEAVETFLNGWAARSEA